MFSSAEKNNVGTEDSGRHPPLAVNKAQGKDEVFAQVYNTHTYYVIWVMGIEAPTGHMLDLQRYFATREGIMDLPLPPPRP
jgi:hypothetical protein